ncbi:ATP-dependent Clp protease ATP-binding subunit clpX [Tothia fuscella]|uniref:ATP-dependent Clp protease ATP-binding subunit clpX n=1 Tax=Tothia fuscella TaxID=1048955 RepID=A0A9P4NEN6_9PEZI|nr:ATP-dependent Clp protease ATP-binding subunit clpX [Tothia fuscella]
MPPRSVRVPKRPSSISTPVSSSRLRQSYLAIYSITRSLSTTPRRTNSHFNRSDFGGQPFSGIYEPGQPTQGPLGGTSNVGNPRITPRMLKEHLDQFVVGQEKPKRVLSTAVYNHYQRIHEVQRQDDEYEELMQQHQRREMVHRHPVEDEFPGQRPSVHLHAPGYVPPPPPPPLQDDTPLTIEKSNVMLLGPSGVGKTLMAKTLARVLEVPFSMSDCTPLTQAGYIGEDVEVVIQRLLAAANYDVSKAEQGIVCLDEIDKIATARVSHGKDVSGEGVQQALLKIIEGTTVQVQAKSERSSPGRQHGSMSSPGWTPHGGGGQGGMGGQQPPGGKNEVFNVRTDNILFICTGAFIGLHKMILDRVSRGSIGFGAHVRASNPDTANPHDTNIKGNINDELFRKHLPFFTPSDGPDKEATYNTLDMVEPADLQKYGMIPELIGRIPISCALSSLDEEALVRVLTEPRNALIKQYEQLFSLSGIDLRFTSPSMREIAKAASGMGTGARGLKTVLERLLGDAMFETPGSATKFILVTEAVAKRLRKPVYFPRGQSQTLQNLVLQEEEEWERRKQGGSSDEGEEKAHNFQEFREKAIAAGQY